MFYSSSLSSSHPPFCHSTSSSFLSTCWSSVARNVAVIVLNLRLHSPNIARICWDHRLRIPLSKIQTFSKRWRRWFLLTWRSNWRLIFKSYVLTKLYIMHRSVATMKKPDCCGGLTETWRRKRWSWQISSRSAGSDFDVPKNIF